MDLDFSRGRFRVDTLDGCLLVEHGGPLGSRGEVVLYRIALEHLAACAEARSLVVLVGADDDWLETEVGEAWWEWIAGRGPFDQAAIVTASPDFAVRFRSQLRERADRLSVELDVGRARAAMRARARAADTVRAEPPPPASAPRTEKH